jgi:hypothetical protein
MEKPTGKSGINGPITEMNTLTDCLNKAIGNGYTESFIMAGHGIAIQSSPDNIYAPQDIHIDTFYRFEGESDPGDMAIMYSIHTTDGIKGTLIDAYGTYADSKVNAFILQVHDIHKKTDSK